MSDEDSKSIFELREETDRDARYERAVKLLGRLASKGYPTEKVIRILNRLGSVDDEGFIDKSTMKGRYRGLEDGVLYGRILNGKNERSFGIKSGQQLGDIHPFVEGTGRTSRLLMNYILVKRGLMPKNLDAELFESHLTSGIEIKDHEIDPQRIFGRTILEFSQQNDTRIWDENFNLMLKQSPKDYFEIKYEFLTSYISDAKEVKFTNIPKVVEMSEVIRNLPDY